MSAVQIFREGRVAPTPYDIWERDQIIDDDEEEPINEIYELFLAYRHEPSLFEHITGLTLQ